MILEELKTFEVKREEKQAEAFEKFRNSYEYLEGDASLLISAPHAFDSWRSNQGLPAKHEEDNHTYAIAEFINKHYNIPVLMSIPLDLVFFDHNFFHRYFNEQRHKGLLPYKQKLKDVLESKKVKMVLDIHGASASRSFDVDIGDTRGKSFLTEQGYELRKKLVEFLQKEDLTVTENKFPAMSQSTVTKFVSMELGVPCLQLEINEKLRNVSKFGEKGVSKFLRALRRFINFVENPDQATPIIENSINLDIRGLKDELKSFEVKREEKQAEAFEKFRNSYEYLEGDASLLISAPHAFDSWGFNQSLPAIQGGDNHTYAIAKFVNKHYSIPVLRNIPLFFDSNFHRYFNEQGRKDLLPYKQKLKDVVESKKVKMILDIQGEGASQQSDSLQSDGSIREEEDKLRKKLVEFLQKEDLEKQIKVTKFVSMELGVPCLQLEINEKLRNVSKFGEKGVSKFLRALRRFINFVENPDQATPIIENSIKDKSFHVPPDILDIWGLEDKGLVDVPGKREFKYKKWSGESPLDVLMPVMISKSFADKLGISPGKKITIKFLMKNEIGKRKEEKEKCKRHAKAIKQLKEETQFIDFLNRMMPNFPDIIHALETEDYNELSSKFYKYPEELQKSEFFKYIKRIKKNISSFKGLTAIEFYQKAWTGSSVSGRVDTYLGLFDEFKNFCKEYKKEIQKEKSLDVTEDDIDAELERILSKRKKTKFVKKFVDYLREKNSKLLWKADKKYIKDIKPLKDLEKHEKRIKKQFMLRGLYHNYEEVQAMKYKFSEGQIYRFLNKINPRYSKLIDEFLQAVNKLKEKEEYITIGNLLRYILDMEQTKNKELKKQRKLEKELTPEKYSRALEIINEEHLGWDTDIKIPIKKQKEITAKLKQENIRLSLKKFLKITKENGKVLSFDIIKDMLKPKPRKEVKK